MISSLYKLNKIKIIKRKMGGSPQPQNGVVGNFTQLPSPSLLIKNTTSWLSLENLNSTNHNHTKLNTL